MNAELVPQAPLRVHPLEFAGKSVKEKLQDIRKLLKGPRLDPCICAVTMHVGAPIAAKS